MNILKKPCHDNTPTCRSHCAACCIAPSISSPMQLLPHGKPAGVPCPHLNADLGCVLFGKAERPAVCSGLQPSREMCGENRQDALAYLAQLERFTAPSN